MSSSESGTHSAVFPQPFGKYTLLSRLASGGMANVFLAQYAGPGGFEKTCVLKRILPHLGDDPQFISMFLNEARIAARLSHPKIVHIFDLGQVGNDYFIAMEYVDGLNLDQVITLAKEKGFSALPWTICVRVAADIAGALDYAHHICDNLGNPLHLVHRDVSPSNIMLSWTGDSKILDFGIAKAVVKDSHTMVGTIKGKLAYMSPEQLQSMDVDARSDVFSLGVILYEMVYGTRPFPGESVGQLTMQIVHEEPAMPEKTNAAIPTRLKTVLLRALCKNPAERWQTARHLQQALEQLLTDQHSPCTDYHIEAYLKKLQPHHMSQQAPRNAELTLQNLTSEEQSVAAPSFSDSLDQNPAPNSTDEKSLSIEEVSLYEQEETQQHRPKEKWAVVAITVIVLLTLGGISVGLHYAHRNDAPPVKVETLPSQPTLSAPSQPLPVKPEVKPTEHKAQHAIKNPAEESKPGVKAVKKAGAADVKSPETNPKAFVLPRPPEQPAPSDAPPVVTAPAVVPPAASNPAEKAVGPELNPVTEDLPPKPFGRKKSGRGWRLKEPKPSNPAVEPVTPAAPPESVRLPNVTLGQE